MSLRLFVCGDVMTGRGIDQVLPHPLNPRLYEPYLSDARAYVDLAENANGPVPLLRSSMLKHAQQSRVYLARD